MSGHCKDSLAYPKQNALTSIALEAEAKPCTIISGSSSTHTAQIENKRTNNIYEVEMTVKAVAKAVDFGGTPPVTEVTKPVGLVRKGGKGSVSLTITSNSGGSASSDEIETGIAFYDGSQKVGSSYVGNPEKAVLAYTVDLK